MFASGFARWPEFRSRWAAFTELLGEGTQFVEGAQFVRTIVRSRAALGAEVLFRRKWRPTCAAEGNPPAHCSHGKGKHYLGRRAHRR
jgi:hypothetical protein